MSCWRYYFAEMADKLDPATRSRLMGRVRQEDTGAELAVRRILHSMGYRYRLHASDLPGRPDIVLPRHRTVVQVNGCFWHGHEGCARGRQPTSNAQFWAEKIQKNRARDAATTALLESMGWRVLVVWECELKDKEALSQRLKASIG